MDVILSLIAHDQVTSSNPTEQVGFFRRRGELRESSELAAAGTSVEAPLRTYLAAFFHDGTEECKKAYFAARDALKTAVEEHRAAVG
ncbi:MAG: hypothetical protein JSS66_06275 [Armatimonadetes bacterium]|nr:hypothetical protein [Armatimonadota bacterium]